MRVEELDTPTLTIDLDALEENLDRYQKYYSEHGIGLRPHIKTHKTLAIASMQMKKGAIGLTCQKIGEAEVVVSGGLDVDILIPYNILGKQKLERLMALAKRTRLTVSADSSYTVTGSGRGGKGGRCQNSCNRRSRVWHGPHRGARRGWGSCACAGDRQGVSSGTVRVHGLSDRTGFASDYTRSHSPFRQGGAEPQHRQWRRNEVCVRGTSNP